LRATPPEGARSASISRQSEGISTEVEQLQ
jgi:hypothetical protein